VGEGLGGGGFRRMSLGGKRGSEDPVLRQEGKSKSRDRLRPSKKGRKGGGSCDLLGTLPIEKTKVGGERKRKEKEGEPQHVPRRKKGGFAVELRLGKTDPPSWRPEKNLRRSRPEKKKCQPLHKTTSHHARKKTRVSVGKVTRDNRDRRKKKGGTRKRKGRPLLTITKKRSVNSAEKKKRSSTTDVGGKKREVTKEKLEKKGPGEPATVKKKKESNTPTTATKRREKSGFGAVEREGT